MLCLSHSTETPAQTTSEVRIVWSHGLNLRHPSFDGFEGLGLAHQRCEVEGNDKEQDEDGA